MGNQRRPSYHPTGWLKGGDASQLVISLLPAVPLMLPSERGQWAVGQGCARTHRLAGLLALLQ